MRALVTGAAGFIGSHLVEALRAADAEVLACDLVGENSLDMMSAEFQELACDFGPEAVFHLAGQQDVATSWRNPARDAELNLVGTLRVYEAAKEAGAKRFVFPSSWTVYSNRGALPYTEESPRAPTSPYGMSKMAAEQYLRLLAARGGPVVRTVVLGNVYGPRDTSVISLFARRMLAGEPITLSAESSRDFVHVSDVAAAMVLAAQHDGRIFERCNVASGVATTLEQIMLWLDGEIGGPPPEAEFVDGSADQVALDVRKAKELWGWAPTVDLESEGLPQLLEVLTS